MMRFRNEAGPSYLSSAEHMLRHPDLRIFASDGSYVDYPAVVLAAASPLLKESLLGQVCEFPGAIMTEFSTEELIPVLHFTTIGTLPTQMNPMVLSAFQALGINLDALKFSEEQTEIVQENLIQFKTFPLDDEQSKMDFLSDLIDPHKGENGTNASGALPSAPGDEDEDLWDSSKVKVELDEEVDEDVQYEGENWYNDQDQEEYQDYDEDFIPPKKKSRRSGKSGSGAISNVKDEEFDLGRSKEKVARYPGRPTGGHKGCLKCKVCNYTATCSLMLEQHILHHRVMDRDLDESYYYCTTVSCLKQFDTLDELKRHWKELHGNGIYPCYECDKAYSRATRRDLHMKEQHLTKAEKFNVTCPQCGTKFTNPRAHAKHVKYENKYHNNTCVYKGCIFAFQTWEEHLAHINSQHGGKILHICGICDETFENRTDRKNHRLANHPQEMNSYFKQCEICGKHTGSMETHKALVHGMDKPGYCHICKKQVEERFYHQRQFHHKPQAITQLCSRCGLVLPENKEHECKKPEGAKQGEWTCEQCNVKFTTKQGLVCHFRLKHVEQGAGTFNQCDQCGETFATISSLKQHITMTHKQRQPKGEYPCPHCPKICTTLGGKYFHIKTTHKLPYHCRDCLSRFRTPEELQEHLEVPCDGQAQKQRKHVTCEVCGKAMMKDKLKQHIVNMHTPEDQKPFRCHLCPKGFAKQRNLDEHVNTHTNSRPFKCQWCDSAFNSSATLSSHEIKVHNRSRQIGGPRVMHQ